MKTASNRIVDTNKFPFTGKDVTVVKNLRSVAQAFSQLQEDRHFADYDLTEDLELADAVAQVRSSE
jgi:hypothetical protein